MPRYFFDIHDGTKFARDASGTECNGREDIRIQAMSALPSIARDEIPKDGDRQAFSVLVRNESNVTVYAATLSFAGLWIGDAPIPELEEENID